MGRSLRISAALACVIVGILATNALAMPFTDIADANDTPGLLDVKHLTGAKSASNSPLDITIQTFNGWSNSVLEPSEPNRIFVYFNVDSDHKAEYRGRIVRSGTKLVFKISGSGSSFEPLKVKRLNATTITTTVPGSSPMNPNGPASIRVKTVYKDTGACSTACVDRAPDHGWLGV